MDDSTEVTPPTTPDDSTVVVPPVVDATVQWTTPVFINGYFATNSILGYALQLLCVAVSTLRNSSASDALLPYAVRLLAM